MTARVFGVGHPDRGDDAVGLAVADAVAAAAPHDVVVHRIEGSPLALLGAWDDADTVVVVDAVRSAAAAGAVRRFDVGAGPLPAGGARGGTHDASLVDAVELARALGRLPARCMVYGVVGERFDVGDGMSCAVRDAVAPTATAIIAELGAATT